MEKAFWPATKASFISTELIRRFSMATIQNSNAGFLLCVLGLALAALSHAGFSVASSRSQPAWTSVALTNEWGDKLSVVSDGKGLNICIEIDGREFRVNPEIVGEPALKSGGVQLEWGFVNDPDSDQGENWRIVSLAMIIDLAVQEYEYSFSPSKGLCNFVRRDEQGNSIESINYCKP